MKNGYSRKELQGWGDIKRPVIKREIGFTNCEILPEVEKQYSDKVEGLVKSILTGFGFPDRNELDIEIQDHMTIGDMYDDLFKVGLQYISSIYTKGE